MNTEQLLALNEDDEFQYGSVLPGLDEGHEKVTWRVQEVLHLTNLRVIMFHVYYFGVILLRCKVECFLGAEPVWRML